MVVPGVDVVVDVVVSSGGLSQQIIPSPEPSLQHSE